ncbi:MAG: autotransporter-associated beta strand repeat-containing protein [Pirellulales bacterium]|nr:autotransporter-associated beta strand repeat-containing protein [Pirellulales bacterium]
MIFKPRILLRLHHPRVLGIALAWAVLSAWTTQASAASQYWDTNGVTAGASAGTTATGTWNGTNAFWNSDPTGGGGGALVADPASTDDIYFSAGANATGATTVTISGAAKSVNNLTLEDGGVTLTDTAGLTVNGKTTANSGVLRLGAGTLLNGDIDIVNTNAGATNAGLSCVTNGQIAAASIVTLNSGSGYAFLRLISCNETVAGITNPSFSPYSYVEATGTVGALTVNGAGDSYGVSLRNGGPSNNLALSLIKDGAGTMTLYGGTFKANPSTAVSGYNSYTGSTTISGGTLKLDTAVAFDSDITDNANLELAADAAAPVPSWTLSKTIAGSGTVAKTGTGTVTLGGGVSNGYSGLTTVTAGTLVLGKTGGAIAIAGNLDIQENNPAVGTYSIVQLGAANQLASTSFISLSGLGANTSSLFRLNGFNQTVAGIGNGGSDSGSFIDSNSASAGTSTLTVSSNSTDSTYSGQMRDGYLNPGVLALTKDGSSTLTLSGAGFSYTGPTTVSGGTLKLVNAGGFSSDITNNATLELSGAAGTGWLFTKSISGNGDVKMNGVGCTVGLTAANTYFGNTIVEAGTLRADNAAALGSSTTSATVKAGALLALYFTSPNAAPVDVQKSLLLNHQGEVSFSADTTRSNVLQGDITLSADNPAGYSFLTAGGDANTVTGTVSGGGLAKYGDGTLNLSGSLTYTGNTWVRDGALIVTDLTLSPNVTVQGYTWVDGSGTHVTDPVLKAHSIVCDTLTIAAPLPLAMNAVPEPGAFALLVLGLLSLAGVAWKRRR